MSVIEREAGAPAIGENDCFVAWREKARAGILRAHSLVGRRLAGLPFGDRLAIDAISPGESDVCLLARLDSAPHSWRRRRAGMRSLSRRVGSRFRATAFPSTALQRQSRARASYAAVRPGRKGCFRAIISETGQRFLNAVRRCAVDTALARRGTALAACAVARQAAWAALSRIQQQ